MKRFLCLVAILACCGCVDRNNPNPIAHPQEAMAVNLEKQNKLIQELIFVQKQQMDAQHEHTVQLKRIADALVERGGK